MAKSRDHIVGLTRLFVFVYLISFVFRFRIKWDVREGGQAPAELEKVQKVFEPSQN